MASYAKRMAVVVTGITWCASMAGSLGGYENRALANTLLIIAALGTLYLGYLGLHWWFQYRQRKAEPDASVRPPSTTVRGKDANIKMGTVRSKADRVFDVEGGETEADNVEHEPSPPEEGQGAP